jgi:hypothetical protein
MRVVFSYNGEQERSTEVTDGGLLSFKLEFIEFVHSTVVWDGGRRECSEWLTSFLGPPRMTPYWDYEFDNGAIQFSNSTTMGNLNKFIIQWNTDFADCQELDYVVRYDR